MRGSYDTRHRLWDILDCIRLIEGATKALAEDGYRQDALVRAAVERWLEIISEASRHIPAEMKARWPDIAWDDVADAGNFLRHAYDFVWPSRTWQVIQRDLPPLRAAVAALYEEVRKPTDPNPPT